MNDEPKPVDVAAVREGGAAELLRQLRAMSGRDWVLRPEPAEVPR